MGFFLLRRRLAVVYENNGATVTLPGRRLSNASDEFLIAEGGFLPPVENHDPLPHLANGRKERKRLGGEVPGACTKDKRRHPASMKEGMKESMMSCCLASMQACMKASKLAVLQVIWLSWQPAIMTCGMPASMTAGMTESRIAYCPASLKDGMNVCMKECLPASMKSCYG